MTGLRIGGLFEGYGGLTEGVRAAIGGHVAWHSEIDPAASKVLAHRYPGVPNHGDITAIDWATVEPVDVLTGGSPCFPAGTLIDTDDGYRPIETVRLGDFVKTHAGRYMPVVELMRREATDTIAVKVMGAPEFVTTREHPFYVRTKGKVWNNDRRRYDRTWTKPEWVAAAFLTTDSFVGFRIDSRDETVASLGAPLAHLIGRWLGDGWVRNTKRYSAVPAGRRGSRINSRWWHAFICCAHNEAAEVEALIRAAGFAPHAPQVNRTATRFRFGSESLVKLLSEFGSGAAGKRIPGWVYRLPVEDQRALWRGWVDSDGSTQHDGQVRVTTVSEQLAHGMARVARNVHRRAVSVHHSPMPATCVIEGRTVNQRDQYQVVLPVANREAFVEGDWCWVPVRSVVDAEPAEVYNFGVAEDQSYTAWGLTVHNCQDVSSAGKRAGMRAGTRSGLWAAMTDAIDQLRPRLIVWENVRGVLSAGADSGLEFCPGCMGDPRDGGPALRALGRVVGDLSSLGYMGRVGALRAADVGAPHGRYRVFVAAHPHGQPWTGHRDALVPDGARPVRPGEAVPRRCGGDPTNTEGQQQREPILRLGERAELGRGAGRAASDTDEPGLQRGEPARGRYLPGRRTPADAAGDRWDEGRAEPARLIGRPDAAVSGDAAAPDTERGGCHGRSRDEIGQQITRAAAAGRGEVDWGQYAPAIERWERVLGRVAPAPTEQGTKGNQRLSPRFVEWMMGLPAGWVTDVPGVSRNDQLKMLGNGVVPLQAAAAVRSLLTVAERAA